METATSILNYAHKALEKSQPSIVERFMIARSISDVKRFLAGEINEHRLKELHPDLSALTPVKERL